MSLKNTETILSEIEAAGFLKVTRMTLLRWRDAGKIQYYRAGWRVLYSVENHLQPFLANCQKAAISEQTMKAQRRNEKAALAAA